MVTRTPSLTKVVVYADDVQMEEEVVVCDLVVCVVCEIVGTPALNEDDDDDVVVDKGVKGVDEDEDEDELRLG